MVSIYDIENPKNVNLHPVISTLPLLIFITFITPNISLKTSKNESMNTKSSAYIKIFNTIYIFFIKNKKNPQIFNK